ncbi:hypothetical protein Fmac_011054 [Flemingia macrophylla]|uniref:Uncharacterized protein n=1 Tax=Flemingia macrophylla TaxID=520843 RepID=A0ABD1MLC4_9FABA
MAAKVMVMMSEEEGHNSQGGGEEGSSVMQKHSRLIPLIDKLQHIDWGCEGFKNKHEVRWFSGVFDDRTNRPSLQGRGTIRKKPDSSQIQAFEILASVAGNFLQENENLDHDSVAPTKDPHIFANTNIKDKHKDERRSFKGVLFEHGSCSEIASTYVTSTQAKLHDNHRYI